MQYARAELLEYGPLGELLLDPTVTEVGIARFDRVTAVRGGRPAQIEPGFSSDMSLRWTIQRLCAASGQPLELAETVVERRLEHGLRISAVLGEAAWSGACLHVRRSRRAGATLDELVRRGAISRAIATFLQQCLSGRVNMLVVGARDGGIDLLMSALAAASSDTPSVWVSDVEVSGEASFNIGVTTLADKSPLSIVGQLPGTRLFAELSNAEVVAGVIESITDGADGVVAARYAPTLRRALMRLPAELASARAGVSAEVAREWTASAFEIIIEVARLRDERHRVLRIAEVTGVQNGEISAVDVFTFVMDRTAAGGAIEGTFSASGVVPSVVEAMRSRGAVLESSIFSRPPTR
jgi:pilus assembly protein CpaF